MFTHPHGGSFRNDGYGVRGPYGKLSLFPYRNFRYMGCDSSSIFFFFFHWLHSIPKVPAYPLTERDQFKAYVTDCSVHN